MSKSLFNYAWNKAAFWVPGEKKDWHPGRAYILKSYRRFCWRITRKTFIESLLAVGKIFVYWGTRQGRFQHVYYHFGYLIEMKSITDHKEASFVGRRFVTSPGKISHPPPPPHTFSLSSMPVNKLGITKRINQDKHYLNILNILKIKLIRPNPKFKPIQFYWLTFGKLCFVILETYSATVCHFYKIKFLSREKCEVNDPRLLNNKIKHQ